MRHGKLHIIFSIGLTPNRALPLQSLQYTLCLPMSRRLLRRLLIRGPTSVLLDNIFARFPTGTCDVEASHIRTPT
ncbi:hypothetical protein XAC3810_550002 [Xanthomonas citri pv. citri]|uniref:Uncharacterized protein n=2 Tax=Xanthomonas TaxID=338 RepID=A0A0U5FNB0_XANCI|nr:hypothetical protein XAC9322_540003 [Xanthomonas citri pv. citri]SOO23296.1 hypothetical protein XFF6991_260002 [Xanthomonas phaseoli pv. phaseoli]CEE34247.1 hypothetical protein XAC3824_720002 [Xanthomonas citri pv. citri]CEE44636.1 hypothetical protein XAC3810_550002 [Xanthomonas citri pv. citri]CEE47849.1 hypothetical protein XAC908_800003 [Xanthomonas citri pv. citri]